MAPAAKMGLDSPSENLGLVRNQSDCDLADRFVGLGMNRYQQFGAGIRKLLSEGAGAPGAGHSLLL